MIAIATVEIKKVLFFIISLYYYSFIAGFGWQAAKKKQEVHTADGASFNILVLLDHLFLLWLHSSSWCTDRCQFINIILLTLLFLLCFFSLETSKHYLNCTLLLHLFSYHTFTTLMSSIIIFLVYFIIVITLQAE